jgi:hypothetical protein
MMLTTVDGWYKISVGNMIRTYHAAITALREVNAHEFHILSALYEHIMQRSQPCGGLRLP